MKPRLVEQLVRTVRRIQDRDRGLAEETLRLRDRVRAEAPVLEGLGIPNDLVAETIVLRNLRPVLAIRRGHAEIVLKPEDSAIWKQRLEQAQETMRSAIRAVGRIEVLHHPSHEWLGTGWLVAPDVVVTNRHVAREFGRAGSEDFQFRPGPNGLPMQASIDFIEEFDVPDDFTFEIERILHIEDEDGPDIAFLKVRPVDGRALASPIALNETTAALDDFVAVIGYPARDSRIPEPQLMRDVFGEIFDKKRFAPGQVSGLESGLILHDCSTLGGNSGSAVVSLQSGKALGLHFAGRFLDANFAVAADVIAQRLDTVLHGEARPRPKSGVGQTRAGSNDASAQKSASSSSGSVSIALNIPLRVTVDVGPAIFGGNGGGGGAVTQPRTGGRRIKMSGPDAGRDGDDVAAEEATPASYNDRKGYDEKFLGAAFKVPLPEVTQKKDDVFTFQFQGKKQRVLKYEHFSVLMSKSRKLCRYSAVNIDGKKNRKGKRPGWRKDGRIPAEAQVTSGCYGDPPKFARGHMTRREDPIWGAPGSAELGNKDSMHYTNAVPQMQPFNAGIWLSLEDYALQNARKDDMRISVFTGPFLRASDPVKFGVKIPTKFWKIIAFIHDDTGDLSATGYTMEQNDFLVDEGVVIADDEFVFGQHKTSQVSIASIESATGLSFEKLADVDAFGTVEEGLTDGAMPLVTPSQIRWTK
jgi:endonuclease G, mitochondrial